MKNPIVNRLFFIGSAALILLLSGCAAVHCAAGSIARKTVAYLCGKALCESDGKVTP